MTMAHRDEEYAALRRVVSNQRAELRRLNRTIRQKESYVMDAARAHLDWRGRYREIVDRYLDTRCPWCRLKNGLRLWSYQWSVWRWIVLFTGGSFGYRLHEEHQRGRREAMDVLMQRKGK